MIAVRAWAAGTASPGWGVRSRPALGLLWASLGMPEVTLRRVNGDDLSVVENRAVPGPGSALGR